MDDKTFTEALAGARKGAEANARKEAFLEAAKMIDDGAKDCRKKVNHPFTASVLEGFSAQFRAKAKEQ